MLFSWRQRSELILFSGLGSWLIIKRRSQVGPPRPISRYQNETSLINLTIFYGTNTVCRMSLPSNAVRPFDSRFKIPKILRITSNPQFQNKYVSLKLRDNTIELSTAEKYEDFTGLSKARSLHRSEFTGITCQAIEEALNSSQGYAPTNVGVSLYVTTTLSNRRFLVLVSQDRTKDMGDYVLKLPSGYVNYFNRKNAISALVHTAIEEASEEILISIQGEILSGQIEGSFLNALRSGSDSLNRLKLLHAYEALQYSKEVHWNLVSTNNLSSLPALHTSEVISVENIPLPNTRLYINGVFGVAQIVFGMEMALPEDLPVSLTHVEDEPKGGALIAQHKPNGAVLASLNSEGDLDGDFFHLREGELVSATLPEEIKLSEAFVQGAPLLNASNISLKDYFERHASFELPKAV